MIFSLISAPDPVLLSNTPGEHTQYSRDQPPWCRQCVFLPVKWRCWLGQGTKTFFIYSLTYLFINSFINSFTHLFIRFIHLCVCIRLTILTSNEVCGQSLINVIEIKEMLIWLTLGLGDRLLDLTPHSLKSPGVYSGNHGSKEKSLGESSPFYNNLSVLFISQPDYQIGSRRHEGEPGGNAGTNCPYRKGCSVLWHLMLPPGSCAILTAVAPTGGHPL